MTDDDNRQSFFSRASAGTFRSNNTAESASEGSDHSIHSITSGSHRYLETRKRGLWTSKIEHILVTMAPNLGLLNYENYLFVDIANGGTVLQVLIAYILVGIPASYMQMVLGQYSHLGVFLIKRMVPIADGAGFSYCLTIIVASVFSVLELQNICLYVILTMVPGTLQWSFCGAPNCWGPWTPCRSKDPCVNSSNQIAAFVYWNTTFMRGVPNTEDRCIQLPDWENLLVSMVCWVIIYLITLVSVAKIKRIIRYSAMIHLLSKVVIALAIVLVVGPVEAFTNVTVMSITNFSKFSAWREATVRVVVTMTLGDFSHVMMGALSSDNVRIGAIAFLSGVISFSSVLLDDIIINSASIALTKLANIPLNDRYILFGPPNSATHLMLMPTIFELLPWTRVWNFLYFANKIFSILFRIIFNIFFLHEAMSHRFPTLASYRKYISPMFCFAAWCMGALYIDKSAFEIAKNFQNVNMYFCQYFNVFFFACMVSYVYGVRRFCDDIHFLREQQPNLYWKIVWMLLPICLIGTLNLEYLKRSNPFFMERLIEILVIFSPYILLTTVVVIKKIIERRTIQLITPEIKWGPREVDRRIKRKHFNPRKATRYMIGTVQCRHMCLVDNKLLKRLVTKEAQIMSRLGGPHARGQIASRTSRRNS